MTEREPDIVTVNGRQIDFIEIHEDGPPCATYFEQITGWRSNPTRRLRTKNSPEHQSRQQ